MITQIATVMIMVAFYAAYFLKMINQRKAGISTVILGILIAFPNAWHACVVAAKKSILPIPLVRSILNTRTA
ncbi:MAG: hypothetical protein MJZ69_08720 [Bacteroidaceae bacterium]|nr:hypothetical protein [Bacteroidaceae bacterium]